MSTSFFGLAIGLVMSIALIYLLLVVNFQSWLDPFIILTALDWRARGRDLGTAYHKHNTKRAGNDGRDHVHGRRHCEFCPRCHLCATAPGGRDRSGACGLGSRDTRLRPVLMTALAMIIGMLPMALGLGEGGEQNAPLGRGVIGGLMIATVATLTFRAGGVQPFAPLFAHTVEFKTRRNKFVARFGCAHSCDLAIAIPMTTTTLSNSINSGKQTANRFVSSI
jgi:hypothetical protein